MPGSTAVDGDVGAWAFLDAAYAREQAARCDRAIELGEPLGPLHGVPVAVKDVIDTADMPTEDGTVLHAGRRPHADATVVARLRQAGAIVLGKTVTAELALYHPGKTKNPHDPARTPGGSSQGSAAAVAAGMAPLAIGTQTNGSIVRPASYCGVVGFKPSHGLISRAGVLPLSAALDHVGVFATGVDDAARLAECLVGYDPRDPDTRPSAPPPLSRVAAEAPPLPPRLAFVKPAMWDDAAPETREAFARAGRVPGRPRGRGAAARPVRRRAGAARVDPGARRRRRAGARAGARQAQAVRRAQRADRPRQQGAGRPPISGPGRA